MQGVCWLAEELLAFKEELFSLELGTDCWNCLPHFYPWLKLMEMCTFKFLGFYAMLTGKWLSVDCSICLFMFKHSLLRLLVSEDKDTKILWNVGNCLPFFSSIIENLTSCNIGCLGDTCKPALLLSLALKMESREHWWNDADKGKLRY